MSDTDTETGEAEETVTCLYPGCDQPAVPKHKHGGPPPRYCANENHNAGSAYQALKEQGTKLGGTDKA
jgi:hypothetical protein